MAPMTIRPGTAADADALAATVAEGFDGYREFAPPEWEPPDLRLEAERMRDTLARSGTWCEVAEVDGRMAGHVAFMSARAHPLGATVDDSVAHLWQLFVRRAYWGGGAAPRLLADAVAEARARGYATMRLFTPEGQLRARRFYEREGWTLFGASFDGGLGIPLVEYRRPLREAG
jgi:GNAT superfamily N-acetyltransferase